MALALLHCLSSSFVIPTPVLQPVILPNAIARAGSAPSMLSLPEGLALGAGAILLITSAGPLALLLAFGGAQMFFKYLNFVSLLRNVALESGPVIIICEKFLFPGLIIKLHLILGLLTSESEFLLFVCHHLSKLCLHGLLHLKHTILKL